jgi:hypothetical protein
MEHERGAVSARYSVMPTRTVGGALVPSMTVAQSLAMSDAPTSEPISTILGLPLRFIGILGLARLGVIRFP